MRVRILFFVALFSISSVTSSFSFTKSECIEMMHDAKTDFGARVMFYACRKEDSSWYNRSVDFRCAKLVAPIATELAAKMTWTDCRKSK